MRSDGEAGKRGYLKEGFRLFHLKDSEAPELDFHYHEFDKVVLQLGGKVTYSVEGRSYFLKPYDILLVGRSMIHKPTIDPSEPYERMVLWLGGDYLANHSTEDCWLETCFERTEQRHFHLLRPKGEDRLRYRELFERLEAALEDTAFGSGLLAETCLLQLMVALNRDLVPEPVEDDAAYRFDPKMEEVTRFMGAHLGENLSIDRLAGEFYLSRYYLMHRFKEVYGITTHQYIRQKRLLRAAEEIRRGTPVLKAAMEAGFNDYSAFLRAFQAAYGMSPREWK